MKHLRILGKFTAAALLLFAVACGPTLTLTDVDFAQPMESVMTPDQNGFVEDIRVGIRLDVTPINIEEQGQNASLPSQVRMIRSRDGYYFITAPGYRNVYVMEKKGSSMELYETIRVSDAGLANPAFNQRSPNVQLIDGNVQYLLSRSGLIN